VRWWVHPDDTSSARKAFEAAFRDGVSGRNFEYRAEKKSGESWYAMSSWEPLRDREGCCKGVVVQTIDITERERAAKALRDSEEKYRTILETMEDAYFEVDLAGSLTFCNDAMCRMLGYPRSEMIGVNYRQYLDEENAGKASQAFGRVHATGAPSTGDGCRVVTARGAELSIEINLTQMVDSGGVPIGFRGVARDITERALALEALRQSEEKYRTVFENTGAATIIVEDDTTISLANGGFVELSGLSRDEIEGKKSWAEFVLEADRERLLEHHSRRRKQSGSAPRRYEFRFVRGNGEVREALLAVDMIPGTKKSVASLLDITDRKRAERKLKEYSERLEHMVEERTRDLRATQELLVQREKLAVLGQLAGGVAHELRNPLAGIKNAVYYLKMILGSQDQDVDEMVDILEREVQASAGIIDSLLGFARVKSPEQQSVSINDVVSKVLERVSMPGNVEVVTDLDGSLPELEGDSDHLSQVLGNFVANAVQAMPDGGKLTISSAVCALERMGGHECVAITVRDTGVGIPGEDLERLFEPLFTTKAKGIGLGLALAKILVEGHGGTIDVHSEVGVGSAFTVRLPVGGGLASGASAQDSA